MMDMSIFKKIERALVEGNLCEQIYKRIKSIFKKIVLDTLNGKNRKKLFKLVDSGLAVIARRRIERETEVNPRKILFVTSRGSYNCNPKAIADEIIRQNLPWALVWVARKENMKRLEQYPKELKLVTRGSFEFYQEAASAKVWIDNSVNLAYLGVRKKPDQFFVETWHGSIGLKRFETNSDKRWIKKAKKSGKETDICISNSRFEDELFQDTFWGTAEILRYGHARNDILVTTDQEKRQRTIERVRSYFGLSGKEKIALYAPTFRDKKDISPYQLDYELLRNALSERFGGEWIILTRLHFIIRKLQKKIQYPELPFVFDATDYEDIQDLLLVTDVGITDYSGWICDFVLTRRPAFFFALDLRSFYQERGFYYPLDSTPFPIAQSNRDLQENILSFNMSLYQKRCEEFITEKGCVDDGHASERVVEKLKEIIEGD